MRSLDWLQLVFIILKLCNVIAWPWWQVMLPYILIYGIVISLRIIAWALIAGDHVLCWLCDRMKLP